MGIGTILESKTVVLLATGENKAQAIVDTVQGPVTAHCPASALQLHRDAIVIIDEAAASLLKNKDFFKKMEQENMRLEESLGNKRIV